MIRLKSSFRPLFNPVQFDRFLGGTDTARQRDALAGMPDYDWHGRKIFFEPYFRALILHRCSNDKTLHDLQKGVCDDRLYAMVGAHMEVSVPALSRANATRPVEPFISALSGVMQAIEDLPTSGKVLRQVDSATLKQVAHLLEDVKVFDVTRIKLPDKIAIWAKTGRMKANFKLHLRLSSGYGDLDRVLFTPGAGNDNPAFVRLLDLEQDAGAIYLFDTGYFKIETYDRIIESGNHLVTLRHRNTAIEVIEARTVSPEPLENG